MKRVVFDLSTNRKSEEFADAKTDRSEARDDRNHNFITKIKLDGFRRKTARRVEAMDGRNHNGAIAPAS